MGKRVSIEFYCEERNGHTVYGAYIGSDGGSGITVESGVKNDVAYKLVPYLVDFMDRLDESHLQDIIDEFKELKSAIEPLSWYEVEEIWCTLGESDNEVELDVSEPDSLIIAVYADINKQTGDVKLSADHITVRGEDGQNEIVNLSKIIKE